MCSIWAAFRCLKNQILRLYMRYKKQGMLLYYSTIKKNLQLMFTSKIISSLWWLLVPTWLVWILQKQISWNSYAQKTVAYTRMLWKKKKNLWMQNTSNLKEEGQITTSGSKSHSSHWNWTVLRQFKSSPIFNKCKPRNRERVDLTNTYKSICIRPSPLM